MNDEEKSAQPSPAQTEPAQEMPDKKTVGEVKHQIDDVVTEGEGPAEMPLHPECGGGERPVGMRKPDVAQAGKGAEAAIFGDQPEVVPKPIAAQCGRIEPKPGEHDQEDAQREELERRVGDGFL